MKNLNRRLESILFPPFSPHSFKSTFRNFTVLCGTLSLFAISGTAKSDSKTLATPKVNPAPLHSKTSKKSSKKKVKKPIGTLYVIGYSHLDTQWCWTYPQVIGEFIPNTLNDNFSLFKKYPDYVFNWTGSNRYRFMQEYYPNRFQTLKKYIASGQWFPAGSCIEEGDVNSPSEEGLIRQVLYANDYFRKEFGIASSEFMLPDCFGFPASLPSILAHCGIKGFSTQKLTWGSAVGIPFNVGEWVGTDNQMVTAALNPGSYGSTIDDNLTTDPYWVGRMKQNLADSGGVGVDFRYYGTGDRGGAPDENSVKNLMKSINSNGEIKVVGGRADTMFNVLTSAQKKSLPHYKGDLELTWHSCGSLTSEGAMKRWNRKNELLADDAEKASVAANWLGAQKYPQKRITDAWLRFLPGQFHDLMAGTALPQAYTYTWNDEILALNESADVLDHSVGAVTRDINTSTSSSGSVPVVVYNPLSINRQGIVSAEVSFAGTAPKYVRVIGPDGKATPSQIDSRTGNKAKVVFLANVPSIGFADYTIAPSSNPVLGTPLKVTDRTLENARYKVTIDNAGDVSSIYDKKVGRELLSAPARLAYNYENPSQFPAWNMDWQDQKLPPRAYVHGPAKFKIVENGPARIATEVTRNSEGSIFHQTISLAAGNTGNRVEYHTVIDWQGKESALRQEFPLTASNPLATYNLGLGTIQRDNNNPKRYEDLHHEWFDLTDTSGKWGTSIMDDCKYGSDKPSDNMVRLTLIYTPGVRGGYQHQQYQDWGRNVMTYAVEGHDGDWRQGQTQWQAAEVDQPLLGFQVPAHSGAAGRDFSFAHVSTPQVQIEAMKKAELSNETIVRLNELDGKSANHVVLGFSAPIIAAREVNGQELPMTPSGEMKIENGKLVFNMTAYRPRAFAIKLGKPEIPLSPPISHPVALAFNQDVASNWADKTNGDFDGKGDTIPGEMLPASINSGGIHFSFGSTATNKMNAIACNGQTIHIPAGRNRKFYFLASSSNGDSSVNFRVGNKTDRLKIQNWGGHIGEWDTRLWGGHVPKLTYDWHNPLVGLVPGFIKRNPVAWYADHFRRADGTPAIYQFCYLFRYELNVPNGVDSIKLPNASNVKIMAATVATDPNDTAHPVQPLYDVIQNRHNEGGPMISPSGGNFSNATVVTLDHPLYWNSSDKLYYTTDGSTPTSSSPVYLGPLTFDAPTSVKVIQINGAGIAGPVTTAKLNIVDRTAPAVKSVIALAGSSDIQVSFSKPLDSVSAEDASHYQLSPAIPINSATLSSNGKNVTLHLDNPVRNQTLQLTMTGVQDMSPNHNLVDSTPVSVSNVAPVYSMNQVMTFNGTSDSTFSKDVSGLPTKAKQPWTINMWVKVPSTPLDLTAIAGFGDGQDSGGDQRYFAGFGNSYHFWGSNVDVTSTFGFEINAWQMVTISYDGHTVRMYKNGVNAGFQEEGFQDAAGVVKFAPPSPWGNGHTFVGQIANFTIWPQALPASFVKVLLQNKPK